MHLPAHNAVTDPKILHGFIQENPLGMLTTAIESETHPFLQCSHIPWLIDSDHKSESGLGRLRGHIARQNPQAKAIIESCSDSNPATPASLTREVLVVFNGPVDHYVTPKFYKQTKPQTGKVVPTWDYEAVEVHGKAKVYFDTRAPEFGIFLATQIRDLSAHMETEIMGYGKKKDESTPWAVDDAPERYIELLTKNIIGIEVEIMRMAGRFKWSQEKPVGDRDGVLEGFRKMDRPGAELLAEKVAERAAIFDAEKMRVR